MVIPTAKLNVWVIKLPQFEAHAVSPTTLPVAPLTVQVKMVPACGLLMAILVASPLQSKFTVGVAVAVGVGFTVITTIVGAPVQVIPPFVNKGIIV